VTVPVTTFNAQVHWSGSTGVGWDHYDRTHTAVGPPAEQEVRLTTGESKGDPRILNPEQLVVIAASSCQMLWFLHLAAKARIDVVEYDDAAVACMLQGEGLRKIVLRPRIILASGSEERARELVHTAHEQCNIAKSLRTPVSIEPQVELRS
jgi:organic hydroperoxide reductase OsmC/OhrA